MKKLFLSIFVAICSSCAISNTPAGHGFLYTEAIEVIYYDPYIRPQQVATLCSHNVMGMFSFGDSSFSALKLNSGIRKISTMEREYFAFLSLYSRSCLITKGE